MGREYVNDNNLQLVNMKYFPFLIMSYMKFKNEQWNDILLSALFMDPMQRIFVDLMSPNSSSWKCNNINYKNELIEDELIECLRQNVDGYTSNIYTKIFCGIWSYTDALQIERVQYDAAVSILKDFDIIIIFESLNETNLQWKCVGYDEFETYKISESKIKHNSVYKLDDFPRLKQVMIALNKYDIDLYNVAKEIAIKKSLECKKYLDNVS